MPRTRRAKAVSKPECDHDCECDDKPKPKPKRTPSTYAKWVSEQYHTVRHLPVRDRLKVLGARWQAMKKEAK